MVSITISLDDKLKTKVERLSWVNWSEVGRQEALKKKIFEKFLKSRTLSDKEWEFCDKIDWHPVDRLPLKKEFVKEVKEAGKGHFIRLKSVDDIFKSK